MPRKKNNTVTEADRAVLDSVKKLDRQILETLQSIPSGFGISKRPWKNVVVCGMGGSALGADVIRYALWQDLSVPVIIVNNYSLPTFVDKNSLIVISSYSGTTEEALACYREARKRKLAMVVLTAGEKFARTAKADHVPVIQYDTQWNPSGQPRLGVGYSIGALIGLFSKTGISKITPARVKKAVATMKKVGSVNVREFKKRSLILSASEHLIGAAHVMSNQTNETAKTFAPYYAIPELNHHLLEGLTSLKEYRSRWLFVFLESENYGAHTKKRYAVTRNVIRKQGFPVFTKVFKGPVLEQSLQAIYWSSLVTSTLAEEAGIDATEIPWVDYFKKELKR